MKEWSERLCRSGDVREAGRQTERQKEHGREEKEEKQKRSKRQAGVSRAWRAH